MLLTDLRLHAGSAIDIPSSLARNTIYSDILQPEIRSISLYPAIAISCYYVNESSLYMYQDTGLGGKVMPSNMATL